MVCFQECHFGEEIQCPKTLQDRNNYCRSCFQGTCMIWSILGNMLHALNICQNKDANQLCIADQRCCFKITNKMDTTIQLTHKSPISEKLLAFFCDSTGQFVSVLFPMSGFLLTQGCVKSGNPCYLVLTHLHFYGT